MTINRCLGTSTSRIVIRDRRTTVRRPVALTGELVAPVPACSVLVRNLSTRGALLSATAQVAPGDRVRLRLVLLAVSAHLDLRAIVRWTHGSVMGVEFELLETRELAVLTRFLERTRCAMTA